MKNVILFISLFISLCNYAQLTTTHGVIQSQAAAAPTCPTNNIDRWKLNDGSGTTAVDVCGSINGTTVNTPSWGADYITLASASSQYVTTGNSTAFDFGTSDFSVSFWTKTSSSDRGVIGNFTDQGGATFRGWAVYFYPNSGGVGNGINTYVYGDGGNTDVAWGSNSAVVDGAWHNITVVYTRSGSGSSTTTAITLYIDGAAITQGGTGTSGNPAATTTGDISSTGNLLLGSNPFYVSLGILYYNGDMSDVRIYNAAISSGTASSIFSAGRGGNY